MPAVHHAMLTARLPCRRLEEYRSRLDPELMDVRPHRSIPMSPIRRPPTTLTGYDEQHLITYLRLLDAETDGADWKEVARIVLHIDPDREPDRARRAWETHLARARWMTEQGYRHLLRGGAPH
jgi:hypothetical protein